MDENLSCLVTMPWNPAQAASQMQLNEPCVALFTKSLDLADVLPKSTEKSGTRAERVKSEVMQGEGKDNVCVHPVLTYSETVSYVKSHISVFHAIQSIVQCKVSIVISGNYLVLWLDNKFELLNFEALCALLPFEKLNQRIHAQINWLKAVMIELRKAHWIH